MEFFNTYSDWILLILGIILDIIGFFMSKPISKKLVALYGGPHFFAGDSRYLEELRKSGRGKKELSVISWGGIAVFVIGLILTILSCLKLVS